MKKVFVLGSLFAVTLFLNGCSNTLRGAGADMKNAGQTMEDTF